MYYNPVYRAECINPLLSRDIKRDTLARNILPKTVAENERIPRVGDAILLVAAPLSSPHQPIRIQ